MFRRVILLVAVLFATLQAASNSFAQEWEPVGGESFEALAPVEDGSLLLLRYPGDILRSTDTGETWSVVFAGHTRLLGFETQPPSPLLLRSAPQEEGLAYGDSGYSVISSDSGRTWNVKEGLQHLASNTAPSPTPLLPAEEGELVHAYAKIGSTWYAVGEPGLICRYDSLAREWKTLHRAPYRNNPFGNGSADSISAQIDFASPAFGAIALGNRMYFTGDSGCTWRPFSPPPSPFLEKERENISSFFFIDDTCTLIGMKSGKLYSCSRSNPVWVLDTQIQTSHPILQIGWQDAYARQLFVLTDSELFTVSADLQIVTASSLPLRSGERALHASFPNSYVGFLLTDSTTRTDTVGVSGSDTTLVHDTSFIYRSLDGGGTWSLTLKNIPGITNFCSPSVRIGYACGENGLLLTTYDSGSTWNRYRSGTKQTLRDIRFVSDSVGYAVGDSGTVLFTYSYGKYWRSVPPEPFFFHPSERYTAIAFPTAEKVWIAAGTKGYAASIRVPAAWRFNRHVRSRVNLNVTLWPNPTSQSLSVDIRLTGTAPPYATLPTVKICDLSGSVIGEVSSVSEATTSEWTAHTDVSFLRPGPYTIIASLAGQNAIAKFVKE